MATMGRLTRACIGTLLAGTGLSPVLAQDTGVRAQNNESATETPAIVVTGTRIQASGFNAPTPVTTLGRDELNKGGEANVADALNELPVFQPSFTPATRGLSTQDGSGNFLDLRGIGANRTLVLLNGRRHVPSNATGTVDVNMIPQALVERVDVVTGGASAAWGSDAVAGVVNFILDQNLEEFKVSAQYGLAEEGDNREFLASAAWGTSFAGGAGHISIGAEYFSGTGIADQQDRNWGTSEYQLIANPAFVPGGSEPRNLALPDTHQSNRTEGGLIVGPSALAGLQFLPGGALVPFLSGDPAGGRFQIGGDGVNQGLYNTLRVPVDRQAILVSLTYELSSSLRLFSELSFGGSQSVSEVTQLFNFAPYTITQDNAFLSPDLRQRMIDEGIGSFQLGRLNTDIGFATQDTDLQTYRGVIGLEGDLGAGWSWSAYYQYGRTDYDARLRNNYVVSRLNQSIDSVLVGGNAVCRVNADADPLNDDPSCVPVNLFGFGSPQQAAIDYFTDTGRNIQRNQQHVAAFEIQGTPFNTWAGEVAVAAGAEYRDEKTVNTADTLSQNNAFLIGNTQSLEGGFNVKEAFAEIAIPLARDLAFAQSLDLNVAIRLTDYSTSGSETTWKIGATYEPTDWLRFRATRSRDIRAPNIGELFTAQRLLFSQVNDPRTNTNVLARRVVRGNLDLEPERANTFTAGAVISPDLIPGLRLSADYFDIDIDGAITTLGAQDIVNRCFAGTTSLCQFVIEQGGQIDTIETLFINLASISVKGFDTELSYRAPVGNGDVTLRLLATHISEYSLDDGINRVEFAGDVGAGNGGLPKWRGTLGLTYDIPDRFSVSTKLRYVGGGNLRNTFVEGVDVNDNSVSDRLYVDLSGEFTISEAQSLTAFAVVNNLFDKDPPIAPQAFQNAAVTNAALYDVIGRNFVVGLRAAF